MYLSINQSIEKIQPNTESMLAAATCIVADTYQKCSVGKVTQHPDRLITIYLSNIPARKQIVPNMLQTHIT